MRAEINDSLIKNMSHVTAELENKVKARAKIVKKAKINETKLRIA